MAHWIQGDGVARSHGLIICTDSYKVENVAKLINVLKIRYNIDCILRFHSPTQPRITIKAKSIKILRVLVMPYMHDSMLYKLGPRGETPPSAGHGAALRPHGLKK